MIASSMSDYRYNAGDDLQDADWPKTRTWAFYDLAGQITTLPRLIDHLLLPDDEEVQREELRKFLQLPAAKPMPVKLRTEVDKFIREGSTRDASR